MSLYKVYLSKGKIRVYFSKVEAFFNSNIKVLIFAIYPYKVTFFGMHLIPILPLFFIFYKLKNKFRGAKIAR